MKNKVETKYFLGMEVRVVNDEYMILKDMFSALGRVKADGTWTNEKSKLEKFLNELGKDDLRQLLVVVKKGQVEEMECLKLTTVPIALTQFKPISSNRRTKEENENAMNCWIEFMKFVDSILVSCEVHKYIVTDKKKQLDHSAIIMELGGKPMIENQMVNKIMAQLIGVEGSIKKDDIRQYQDQTTIDLLEAREYLMSRFEVLYESNQSHKETKEALLRMAARKYPQSVLAERMSA